MARKESAHVFPAAPPTAEGPEQAKGAITSLERDSNHKYIQVHWSIR